MLRGEATNNTVQLLNSVRLNSNKAPFGGGLFIAFYDNASGNTVTVDNAEVTENEVLIEWESYASGGGIFIGFAATGTNRNAVSVNSSRIISNEADIGGGISVNLVHNACVCPNDSNIFLVTNCLFDNNTASQGSSAYLSQSGKCSQPLVNTTVSSSDFTNAHCGTVLRDGHILRCNGNLLVQSMPHVVFQGTIMFTGDQQHSYISALSLRSSSIELSPSAQLLFINNSAVNGAGIHLVDSSYIVLNTGSTILFKHNTASGQGGAIYVDTCTKVEDCVFKHSNPALHPDDWGVNITFIDNRLTSGQANAIFVDSIQSYKIWSNSLAFCWTGWSYNYIEWCPISELRSAPVSFEYTGSFNFTINSEVRLYDILPLRVYDSWGNDITDPDKIPVEVANGSAFIDQPGTLSSFIHCFGDYTQQNSSLLYIHPLQFPVVAVTIYFEQCNLCGYCQSLGSHGACPPSHMKWYAHSNQYMCGKCSKGYAVAINDPDLSCIKCNSPYYGVAVFLFLQLMPTLILLTLLAVLHIKITDGSLSGFVLFSQMVSLQFPGLGFTSWVATMYCERIYDTTYKYFGIPLTVYSIWNLNFLNLDPVPFCIPQIDTAAEAILLQYITAACPLVFIVVTYTWIKWYNNGYTGLLYIPLDQSTSYWLASGKNSKYSLH